MNFIADVHLGKLARLMRMLGFDTVYSNSFTKKELVSIAMAENRILLSRNAALRNIAALPFFIVNSEDPETQLKQVLTHYNLKNQFAPFTRCLACNGTLRPVTKDAVSTQLQQNTLLYFNEFWQCDHCKSVYWKGSHYERMHKLVEKNTNS